MVITDTLRMLDALKAYWKLIAEEAFRKTGSRRWLMKTGEGGGGVDGACDAVGSNLAGFTFTN